MKVKNNNHGPHCVRVFILLWLCCIVGAAIQGCKSSRTTTTTTEHRTAAAQQKNITNDISRATTISTQASADTAVTATTEWGVVEIARDSVGNPAFIRWQRTARKHSTAVATTNDTEVIAASSSSSSSTIAAAVATEKQTATTSTIKTHTLEQIIGMIVLALVMLYVVITIITKFKTPWR